MYKALTRSEELKRAWEDPSRTLQSIIVDLKVKGATIKKYAKQYGWKERPSLVKRQIDISQLFNPEKLAEIKTLWHDETYTLEVLSKKYNIKVHVLKKLSKANDWGPKASISDQFKRKIINNVAYRIKRRLAAANWQSVNGNEKIIRPLVGDEKPFSQCGSRFCQDMSCEGYASKYETICCGKPVKAGSAYCAHHHAINTEVVRFPMMVKHR